MSDRDALLQIKSIVDQALAPVVNPPILTDPVPLPPRNNPYPGVDLWNPAHTRLSTPEDGIPPETPVRGGFTVPASDVGQTVEIPISGAGLKVFVDHEEYVGPFAATLGDHVLAIILPAAAGFPRAAGSIDLQHHP